MIRLLYQAPARPARATRRRKWSAGAAKLAAVSEPRVAFDLDREDFRVLLLSGRAMLSGQMLEFSVFQLAQLEG